MGSDRLSGNEAATRAMEHWPEAFGLALQLTGRRAEAEDVAQEAFLRLSRHAGEVDGSRPLRGLVLRIVRNLVIDRARRGRAGSLDEAGPADGRATDPFEAAARSEERSVLRAALEGLSPRWRSVLYLRDGLDLSYREIGEVVGITEDVVRVTLHRARRRLRDHMSERLSDDREES
ncbi:MAG: sigma-70 family RNA polymerase sigma factor [Planctomycetota bacterium]